MQLSYLVQYLMTSAQDNCLARGPQCLNGYQAKHK